MMQTIILTARIFDSHGAPAARLEPQLEAFLADGGWTALAKGQVDAEGALSIRAQARQLEGLAAAPALRLVEPGDPAPRVLAEGGMLSLSGSGARAVLTVDFGEIERLEDTAHLRATSSGEGARGTHTVAGLPRRGGIAEADLVRAAAASNESLLRFVPDRASVLEAAPEARATVIGADQPAVGSALESGGAAQEAIREGVRQEEEIGEITLPGGTGILPERFQAEMLSFAAREETLRADLRARELQIETLNDSLTQRQQAEETLRAEFEAERTARAELEEQTASLREAAERQTEIGSIASAIASEVAQTNSAIAEGGGGFRIEKLNVNLRGTLSPEGGRIALSSAADLARAGAERLTQNISFDLIADRPQRPAAGMVRVPDLAGLTEAAARRRLAAVGLRVATAQRPGGATAGVAIGQALAQSPAAGSDVDPGTEVLVVFAAPTAPREGD